MSTLNNPSFLPTDMFIWNERQKVKAPPLRDVPMSSRPTISRKSIITATDLSFYTLIPVYSLIPLMDKSADMTEVDLSLQYLAESRLSLDKINIYELDVPVFTSSLVKKNTNTLEAIPSDVFPEFRAYCLATAFSVGQEKPRLWRIAAGTSFITENVTGSKLAEITVFMPYCAELYRPHVRMNKTTPNIEMEKLHADQNNRSNVS